MFSFFFYLSASSIVYANTLVLLYSFLFYFFYSKLVSSHLGSACPQPRRRSRQCHHVVQIRSRRGQTLFRKMVQRRPRILQVHAKQRATNSNISSQRSISKGKKKSWGPAMILVLPKGHPFASHGEMSFLSHPS